MHTARYSCNYKTYYVATCKLYAVSIIVDGKWSVGSTIIASEKILTDNKVNRGVNQV